MRIRNVAGVAVALVAILLGPMFMSEAVGDGSDTS